MLYPLTDLWYNTAKLNWIHFLCPQRSFGRHIVITLSVRPSVPLCPVHISYILWGRNSKFGVWLHFAMAKCRVPFSGDLDLWFSFYSDHNVCPSRFVSGAYLLYSLSRALTRILKTGVQDSHLAKSRSPTGKSGSPNPKKLESHQFVHTVYFVHFSGKWYIWIIFRLTDFNPLSINVLFLLNKKKYFGIFFNFV